MQTVCNESEREEEQGALAAGLCARLPRIPLFFLGLGMYRAWIEISFVGSFVSFPTQQFAGHDTFDFAMIATLFLCALFAKKIGPFFKKKLVYGVAGTLLVVSTLCIFLTLFIPALAPLVAVPAAVGGGIGIAFVILLWSELYSCLNPIRVALYYSASIILAAFIIYVCRGFLYPWLFVAVLALPIATLACLVCGFKSLPANELPQAEQGKFSFPWKPVLLMSIYAFAYGLREAQLYSGSFGPHSAFGTVAVAAVVFIGVVARGGKFDFALMYRIALPLMVGAFLVLPGFGFMNQSMSNFCVSASYTAFSILIMLILANMSYRYGMSAIWLFSIERGVRALFSLIGRQSEVFMSTTDFGAMPSDVMIGAVVVLLIVACSVILFSEKELSSRWGVTFLGGTEGEGNKAILKKQELANRCQDLARQCGLSQREEEVLLLLAQHKTVGAIERELFIANGTAKTHTRHIYRKLDIHSRDEL
ncbi:MAG: LuxR C-terminal-related transcriptional regulator, partial [Raoultibacter sp.]